MGAEKRKKWIKLNAMGIVLHDFCGFYRRGKKKWRKRKFQTGLGLKYELKRLEFTRNCKTSRAKIVRFASKERRRQQWYIWPMCNQIFSCGYLLSDSRSGYAVRKSKLLPASFIFQLVVLCDWPSRAIYASNLCGILIPWSDGSNRDDKLSSFFSSFLFYFFSPFFLFHFLRPSRKVENKWIFARIHEWIC